MRVDRHWWRTRDGGLVPHGHPDACTLAFPRGHDVPDRLAQKMGLRAAVEQFTQADDDVNDDADGDGTEPDAGQSDPPADDGNGTEAEVKQSDPPANKMAGPSANKTIFPPEGTPVRPPASGPGSGVEAWRKYAGQVTNLSPKDLGELSRDEIIDLLESESAEG